MKERGWGFLIFFALLIVLLPLVSSAGEKIELSLSKETFSAGESITLKASLYDSSDIPKSGDINLVLEDAQKNNRIEQVIKSNSLVDISLEKDAPAGYWKATAEYISPAGETIFSSAVFMIGLNEFVKFEIINSTLFITNVGNTRYARMVYITIGETIGTKNVDISPGEAVSFRLVAPKGTYAVKVTDGKTTINEGNVVLTGKIVGVLDERVVSKSPLTGEIKESTESIYGEEISVKRTNNFLVYTFLIVIFAAAILLAIERKYRKAAHY
jgi:hypothetical protein